MGSVEYYPLLVKYNTILPQSKNARLIYESFLEMKIIIIYLNKVNIYYVYTVELRISIVTIKY